MADITIDDLSDEESLQNTMTQFKQNTLSNNNTPTTKPLKRVYIPDPDDFSGDESIEETTRSVSSKEPKVELTQCDGEEEDNEAVDVWSFVIDTVGESSRADYDYTQLIGGMIEQTSSTTNNNHEGFTSQADFVPLDDEELSGNENENESNDPLQSLRDKKENPYNLSKTQKLAFDTALNGDTFFFTGPAGTGKTFVLKKIVQQLRRLFSNEKGKEKLAVTSMTGIAAQNVGGETIHRWSGWTPAHDTYTATQSIERISEQAKNNWKNTKVLIIDEISMMSGTFFNKLDQMGRIIKGKENEFFGGMQLILTGDFFQLPPVKGENDLAFDSSSWKENITKNILLKEVHRQKNDQEFSKYLTRLQRGDKSKNVIEYFKKNMFEQPPDKIEPTRLCSSNREVEEVNRVRLMELKDQAMIFKEAIMYDRSVKTDADKVSLRRRILAPEKLVLKRNANVMLTKNSKDNDELVNGSQGTVITFATPLTAPLLDNAEREVLDIWEEIIENNYQVDEEMLVRFDKAGYKADVKYLMIRVNQELSQSKSTAKLYPLVKFSNGVTKLVGDVQFEVYDHTGVHKLCIVTQVPLILSWAMTIHKSQGQTLDYLIVDSKLVFAPGQLYVALSRVKTREGLYIEPASFNSSKIKVLPNVVRFMKQVEHA